MFDITDPRIVAQRGVLAPQFFEPDYSERLEPVGRPDPVPRRVGGYARLYILSPANCDVSGQWLPGISNWSLSFGAEYNLPATLFGRAGLLYLAGDGSYRSKFSSNASRSIYTDIDGYALANVRFGFRTRNGFNLYGCAERVRHRIFRTACGDVGQYRADRRATGRSAHVRLDAGDAVLRS